VINIAAGSSTQSVSLGSNASSTLTASPDQGNNNIGIIGGVTVGAVLSIALCVVFKRTKHLVSVCDVPED
jgi:hypothetical protein